MIIPLACLCFVFRRPPPARTKFDLAQPAPCQGFRPRHAADLARARRRGHRI